MSVNPRVLAWAETDLGVTGTLREVVRAPAAVLSAVGAVVDPTSPEVVRLAADLVATAAQDGVMAGATVRLALQ